MRAGLSISDSPFFRVKNSSRDITIPSKKKLYIQSILCYNFLVEVVVYKVAV